MFVCMRITAFSPVVIVVVIIGYSCVSLRDAKNIILYFYIFFYFYYFYFYTLISLSSLFSYIILHFLLTMNIFLLKFLLLFLFNNTTTLLTYCMQLFVVITWVVFVNKKQQFLFSNQHLNCLFLLEKTLENLFFNFKWNKNRSLIRNVYKIKVKNV